MELCDHAGLRAGLPRRALRGRPDRGPGADGGCAESSAARCAAGRTRLACGRADRGEGAHVSSAPVDIPNPPAPGAEDEEPPSMRIPRRQALFFGLFSVSAIAFLYFGLPRLAGFGET